MKYLMILVVIIALGYVMVKRGRTMKEKFYGKSEEEINDTLKKMIP